MCTTSRWARPASGSSCARPRPATGRLYVYSGRDGRQLLTVDGEAAGDQFGAAVGAAGDVDRDGRADLIVGAPCHDGPAGVDAGKAYVVSGRSGRILRTHDGAEPGDGFGWGAAGLGDGGYIVGAKDAGPGDRGLAYVYDGRRGTTRFVLAGDAKSYDFGWFFVANAGRVDGDRTPDIYVGDFCGEDETDQCALPRGQAYVFSGRTGRLLHLFRGEQPNDGAGPGRSAGDVNHDGRDDIVVGYYFAGGGAGRVVVYSGRTGRIIYDRSSTVRGRDARLRRRRARRRQPRRPGRPARLGRGRQHGLRPQHLTDGSRACDGVHPKCLRNAAV